MQHFRRQWIVGPWDWCVTLFVLALAGPLVAQPGAELSPYVAVQPYYAPGPGYLPPGVPSDDRSAAPPQIGEAWGSVPPGVSFPPEPVAEDEDSSWYPWQNWFDDEALDSSLEIGVNASEGNSTATSVKMGGTLKWKTDWSTWAFDGVYSKATAKGVETQHNALFNAKADFPLGSSGWSMFGKLGLEYDEFKAFNLRLVLNGGLQYTLLKSDFTTLAARLGSGTSREIGGPDDRWVPEAVLGVDFEHKLTRRQKFKAKVDYYPEWTNFSNYRLATDVAWEVVIDEGANLSFKLGVIDRYDSTPNGVKPNDLFYSMLLIWKL